MMSRASRCENVEEHDDTDSCSNNEASSSVDEKKGKLDSSGTPRNEKRRVHWKPTAKVILIPKREEYINAGLGSTLWWGGADYASFRHSTADELSRCMKSLQIGGREAMTVLYQSGCPKSQSTVFENLVIAIPDKNSEESDCTLNEKKSEFKRDAAYRGAEKFHSIVPLSCMISAIDKRTDNFEDLKYMNMNIRCSTSLLFEEVLNSENADLSMPPPSVDSEEASGTSGKELWADLSRRMCESAVRYHRRAFNQILKHAAKISPNNPIFSSRFADYPTLPSTWDEAMYGEEWADKSFVITEDKPPFKIVHCNKSWECLTGYTAKDFVGNNFRILHGPLTQLSKLRRIGKQLQQMREEREAEQKKSTWFTKPPPPKYLKVSIINYTKKGHAFNMILLMGFIDKCEADHTSVNTFILATSLQCLQAHQQ